MPALDLWIARLRHHHHLPRPLRRADPAEPAAHPERVVPGADACAASSAAAPATSPTTCAALGGEPVVDGRRRRRRRRLPGAAALVGRDDRARARESPTAYTAQAFIITDRDNNQITAFHPGAMQWAHETAVPARSDIRIAIIAPDGRDAMLAARRASSPLPASRSSSIRARACRCSTATSCARFVDQATWVAVNDYEAQMLVRAHRPLARGDVALAPARRRRHARRAGLRGLAAGREARVVPGVAATRGRRPDRLRRRLSRRAAVRPRARLAAGRLRRASATGSARSRSPAAAARIMCWIARLRHG